MKIIEIYSHLYWEEFLLARKPHLYEEIKNIILDLDATQFKTKVSEEKTMMWRLLYSPVELNKEFKRRFNIFGWDEDRYQHCITTDRKLMEDMLPLDFENQKKFLKDIWISNPMTSYKQTDFVKDGISVEVQFWKYAFVAFDLFVKHLMFYSWGKIDVGIEILPVKSMCNEMSSGVAYYEWEVYNVLRHGRTSPPVPLVIIGIAP